MFSFRALNDHVECRLPVNGESSSHFSDESCITDCSLLSGYEKQDSNKGPACDSSKALSAHTIAKSSDDAHVACLALSPNVLDLLRPSKKNTRETEEVRVIKLYRYALRLCSSEKSANELSATPLLESIVGSFLLKSNDLPTQLNAIKFATCKLLGGIYMKSKQNKKAMKFLIKAIELDRNDLTLWLRLTRVSIRLAKFDTATIALDHILCERPSHPVALPLALTVYLALSEFETCLDLAARSLQLDPLNDRAIYCVQYILHLQPNLSFLVEDLLKSRPDLLEEKISDCSRKQLDEEFHTLRSRYREQLDAQADSRKIATVQFPERLSSLTWPDLMETCLNMFDRLSEESTLRSVLDLSSLLPDEAVPQSIQDGEGSPRPIVTDTCMRDEQFGVKEPGSQMLPATSAPSPNPLSEAASLESASGKNESEEVVAAKDNVGSDGANRNLPSGAGSSVEPIEKRRSARARPDVDLTDGLNRYRSRRVYSLTNDGRSNVKSPGRVTQSTESKLKPLNRFRCAEQLRSLLPALFRDLAKTCGFELTRHPETEESTSQAQPAVDSAVVNTASVEETDSLYSDLWSPEAVAAFIGTMRQMQPNVVTFGIALLLQVSQLHGDPWSVRLSQLYVSLSERLRPSLPRWCLAPSEYRRIVPNRTEPNSHGLLPIDVLGLRSPPSLEALTRFHLVYAELRLEQLECILSPNFVPDMHESPPSDPRTNSNENLLSNATVLAMVDVLSFHEPGSVGFAQAQAHYLWINYLLASVVQDYTEMEGYLAVLKDHLIQYKTSVTRNYSVYHGPLSVDHIDKLLNQLSGVSEFERLCRLSTENKHGQIVAEIALILEQRRRARREPNAEPNSRIIASHPLHTETCGHVKDTDLLSLLKSSLEHLVEQYRQPSATVSNDPQDAIGMESTKSEPLRVSGCHSNTPSRIAELRTCYMAAVLLLESASSFGYPREKDMAGDTILSGDTRMQLDALAVSAISLILNLWDLLANEHCANTPSTPEVEQTNDLVLVSKLPLRFDVILADEQEDVMTTMDSDSLPECNLSIGEACLALCLSVDLVALRLETTAPASSDTDGLLTQRFITFVFELLLCVEQSIPAHLLPHPLRAYHESSHCWIDQIPTDLLLALHCGQSAAPPSLAWLHWVHELLTRTGAKAESTPRCRERRDLLALLRQLVSRTTAQLQLIVATVRGKATSVALTQSMHSSLSSQSDTSVSDCSPDNSVRPFCSEDEFVQLPPTNEDDNTVACVDELVSSGCQPWPVSCVSLNQILAQAILCLVPSSLFRQLEDVSDCGWDRAFARRFRPSYSPVQDRSDAPGSDDELSPAAETNTAAAAMSSMTTPVIVTRHGSDSEPTCVTPEWIQHVNRLLTERHWCSHTGPLCSSHPAWWLSQVNKSPDTKSDSLEEIKLLDWTCIKTVFEFCYPTKIPEYDSVKTLSISNELLNLLLETTALIPRSEQSRMLTAAQVEEMLETKAADASGLLEEPTGLSSLTQIAFYLIADYYMKNNNFELATKYYLEDLRACPRRSNTWAALGLIYYSELEQIINLTNLKTERVSPDAVSRCLRCFAVAISLMPYSVTLLIERGCLAYQLHAYAARVVKKASSRSFPDAHLNLCRKWRSQMLQLARSCYEHVLSMRGTDSSICVHGSEAGFTTNTSEQPTDGSIGPRPIQSADCGKHVDQAKDEEWLCRYMLSKCAEKEATLAIEDRGDVRGIASYLLSILKQYDLALKALDAAGAKYPKKVIVYHKLPFRAVEAIEVFYRIHALTLKTLLNYGPPESDGFKCNEDQIPLVELRQFLIDLQSSEFVASCGKPRRGKKRTATSAGLTTKQPPAKQAATATGSVQQGLEVQLRDQPVADDPTAEQQPQQQQSDPITDPQSPRSAPFDPPSIKPIAQAMSSQDEFIDLTSPDPATLDDDDAGLSDPADPILKNPQALWQDCVDRCRVALELVLQRLPLHYKAMYRLADLYLRAPHIRDPLKTLSILMGPVNDSYKSTVGGLFKDRKQNNFFHGVWRIPTSDIDRSGNFAAHMFRSVSLTLDTLSERGDWRHLVHIFHQLRKQPPEEKRGFLGEGDRVYLARRAFNLIQPTLLIWLTQLSQSLSGSLQDLFTTIANTSQSVEQPVAAALQALLQRTPPQSASFINLETMTQIYRLHCVSYSRNCQPGCSPRASIKDLPSTNQAASSTAAVEVSGYAEVLQLAYRLCPSAWDSRGPDIDLGSILQRCTDLTCSRSSSPGSSSAPTSRSDASRTAAVTPTRAY